FQTGKWKPIFLVRVVAAEQENRLPFAGLEAGVDALRLGRYFVKKLLVTRDMCAAGSANLNKGKTAMIRRVRFQEVLDPAEALEDSLRIIDAIDAHAEKGCLDAQFFT